MVRSVEARHQRPIEVTLVNDSVRTMLRDARITERLGRFDFVYSMGLFDYLTPPVAKAVMRKLYELLEPGGTAVVGNYHVANPSRFYMAYWCDWSLFYRSEEEMLALAETLPGARLKLDFDDTRCQMFLRVTREEAPSDVP